MLTIIAGRDRVRSASFCSTVMSASVVSLALVKLGSEMPTSRALPRKVTSPATVARAVSVTAVSAAWEEMSRVPSTASSSGNASVVTDAENGN